MSKSRFVLDKFAKLIEQGFLNNKDLSEEIVYILKSKRDEFVFRMKLTGKEETDILSQRVEKLEKKINTLEKKLSKKTKKGK